ncbi:MAG: serine/threonine phosphatase [Symploca sp. SIO2C1]|nr:serine/threonine phosphatase [Symploca sp. SIO2C1]
MLICPKCQFKNQDANKFCQRCGTSLTQRSCHECGIEVPVNAETCHNCNALTGTIFWAIISKDLNALASPEDSQELLPEDLEIIDPELEASELSQKQVPPAPDNEIFPTLGSASPTIELDNPDVDYPPASASEAIVSFSDETVTQPLSPSDYSNVPDEPRQDNSQHEAFEPQPGTIYLDSQQRYQLLESQKFQQTATSGEKSYILAGRVLDCQPFQESLLDALVQEESELSWEKLIPKIAQPYLILSEDYSPTLPKVYDIWEQEGKAVVLLEDRSQWQLIIDLWGNEEIEMLQILEWLDGMALLWEVLEPWRCRQSLLEITNLRVDEDGVLALQCLYPEPQDHQLTLEDLGQMWRQLFSQSQRTQLTALDEVFRQLCNDEIKSVEELRSRLQGIGEPQASSETTDALNYPSAEEETITEPIAFELPEEPPTAIPPTFLLNDDIPSNEGENDPTIVLPMELSSLIDAGYTDIGHQRDHNEDSFGIETTVKKQENRLGRTVEARGLYVLCDGMGGHSAGEVASAMAVETLKRYFQENWHDQFPTEETIREAVLQANEAIYNVNQKNASSGSGRMGTTLVMILVENTKVAITHVGDSRLYRVNRKQGLEQITVDHEVGQREIQRGVEPAIAYSRPDAYQLTQALGPRNEEFVNPDVQFLEINEDTLFLLCSDGLSDNELVEKYWQTNLAPLISSRANLERGVQELIDLANAHNGHDNITAVVVRLKVRPDMRHQRLF